MRRAIVRRHCVGVQLLARRLAEVDPLRLCPVCEVGRGADHDAAHAFAPAAQKHGLVSAVLHPRQVAWRSACGRSHAQCACRRRCGRLPPPPSRARTVVPDAGGAPGDVPGVTGGPRAVQAAEVRLFRQPHAANRRIPISGHGLARPNLPSLHPVRNVPRPSGPK